MSLAKDTSGQMSIDFLAGVAIFLIALLFVFAFIPGMFTSFQSNSDELTMAADRVSTELVENILVTNGSTPNVIDSNKVVSLDTSLNDPIFVKSLGQSGGRAYNINVTFSTIKGYYAHAGPQYPVGALNVGQSRRIVDDEFGNIGIIYVTVW
jgi:hypothetical protein